MDAGYYTNIPRTGVVPPYNAFTVSPPVIPTLSYDVYSQEERIKALCCEIEKLTQYSNLLSATINNIETDVDQKLADTLAEVDKRLATLKDELVKLINEVMGTSLDWDVTTGTTAPTIQAHRNLYHWVTTTGMTIDEFNKAMPDMTVQELADCGLNCQGWAVMSRTAFGKGGMGDVPGEYLWR